MRTLLAAALVVPLALLNGHASASGCTHLLVDAVGDANHAGPVGTYPTAVDDPRQVDIVWAELRTTSKTLVATMRLTDLEPEGQANLDHVYTMTFDTAGRTIELVATFGSSSTSGEAWTAKIGSGRPQDGDAYVGQYLGDIEVSRDKKHDRVTFVADRGLMGGVTDTVRHIGAVGWVAVVDPAGGATYAVADTGDTDRTFRAGQRACLS